MWSSARELCRSLRPTAWVVLEDVAHDAKPVSGVLVAHTSARGIAEHLALNPGTVASALRALRRVGLVELRQESAHGGRFGLAAYTVHLPAGIELTRALCRDRPRTVLPHVDDADAVAVASVGPSVRKRRSTASRADVTQATLGLELGDR